MAPSSRSAASKCSKATFAYSLFASVSGNIIQHQLIHKKIKRDIDVRELYLAEKAVRDLATLSRFKKLRYLWLNNNKLRRVTCLSNNYCLSELYLHNNNLVDITGALGHLTSLEVLTLNNNQLEKLEKVVSELKAMQTLKTLNLSHNPVAQEPGYRHYVIFNLPSVQIFDISEVLKSERDDSDKYYGSGDKETIAFGRRSPGSPGLHYPADKTGLEVVTPVEIEVGNNFYRNNPPYSHVTEAIHVRQMRRSVMEYSSFDWSKVPRAEERRTMEKSFENPQVVTTRFR